MPNRVLREGILTSERVNKLTLEAEVFYRRLLSVVDDYGRYFAHPALLRAACYPLRLDDVTEKHISRWLDETKEADLTHIYNVKGTNYLEIIDFRQRIRADNSKFPECQSNDCHNDSPLTAGRSPVSTTTTTTSSTTSKGFNASFDEFWGCWPKTRRVSKVDARKAWLLLKPNDDLVKRILEFLKQQVLADEWAKDNGKYIPHPHRWLNKRRWEDEVEQPKKREKSITEGLSPEQLKAHKERLSNVVEGIGK